MKKIQEIIKPFLSIIFGAILLLFYLNWLSFGGATLAIGIVAVILSSYYLVLGIVEVIIGEKLSIKLRNIFDIVSISLFPAFMFVIYLVNTINFVDTIGPTGWVIAIIGMIASLAIVIIYITAKTIKNSLLKKLCFLFAAIFVLSLLLSVLFDVIGNPITLGNIDIIAVVIYAVYVYMLMNSINKIEN